MDSRERTRYLAELVFGKSSQSLSVNIARSTDGKAEARAGLVVRSLENEHRVVVAHQQVDLFDLCAMRSKGLFQGSTRLGESLTLRIPCSV